MTLRIRFRDEAKAEITSAVDWYDAQRAGLGAEFTEEVNRVLQLAAESPRMWTCWRGLKSLPEIRRALLSRFPFLIAYLVRDEELVVLAVPHAARRPGYWFSRARR